MVFEKRIYALALASIALMGTLGCQGTNRTEQRVRRSLPFEAKRSIPADSSIRRFQTPELQSPEPNLNSVTDAVTDASSLSIDRYPIDFPTVLRLAGADNWNVKIARQRVHEASAEYCKAKSAWLPSISLGLGFNQHEGQIQRTGGDVVTVSRNSTFIGAGAGIGNTPLNGGSGGPSRMVVDFSFADAFFQPLAARRMLGSEQARQNRVFNDTMLKASLAYYDLVGAQASWVVAQTNLAEAQNMLELTRMFVESGKGTPADISRIRVIVNQRLQKLAQSKSELQIASARLATHLQLDPTKLNPETGLYAVDSDLVPIELIDMDVNLNSMIQQAQNLRAEIAEANAVTHAAQAEMMAEQWRPWLPNLYLGYSGGVFGGGQGSNVPKLDGRSDFDVALNWQIKNLGVGTRANQDATRSRVYQRNFEMRQIRDQIAEQVTTTFQRVRQYGTTMELLRDNIEQAGQGLEKNLVAIKGLEGLPLEAIASLLQLANARSDYLASVINYNQWQIRLLRAAGQSLSADAEMGQIANFSPDGCDVCVPDCPACFKKPTRCKTGRSLSPIRSIASKIIPSSAGTCDCADCSTTSHVTTVGLTTNTGSTIASKRLLFEPTRTAWFEATASDNSRLGEIGRPKFR